MKTRKLIEREKVVKIGNHKNLEIYYSNVKKQNRKVSNAIHAGIHDVRSPLTVIKPYIEFLKRIDDKQKRNSILGEMKTSVSRIEKIIDGLVEYTDIILLDIPTFENINLNTIVNRVEHNLTGLILETDAKVLSDFSQSENIYFNAFYLEKIFFHLLQNAIQYRHPERKPIIKVSSHQTDKSLILSFEDNGLGLVKEEMVEKQFGLPFTKLKHNSSNVGLGLAIVKTIVEKSKGQIIIESSSKGTNIQIELPQ